MKALDTNVLVRFLVQDDPAQVARAQEIFALASRSEEPLHVSTVVLAELVWVLESGYGLGRTDVAQALEMLLEARELRFEERDLVRSALHDFASGLGGLADCLIGRLGRAAGCETTLTFDRSLRRNHSFELI